MTEKDEAKRLEERLINFGRYIREGHAPGVTTCTYIDLATEKQPDEDEEAPAEPQPPLDVRDAEKVLAAWQRMNSMHADQMAQKGLIGLLYATPNRGFDYYSSRLFRIYKIRIRQRDFDEIIKRAKKSIARNLRQIDNKKMCP